MEAVIRTTRYRYARDGRTGRTPSYTEWKLFIDDELKATSTCGVHFNNVSQFEKSMKERFDLTEITREKPYIHNLGFNAQAM